MEEEQALTCIQLGHMQYDSLLAQKLTTRHAEMCVLKYSVLPGASGGTQMLQDARAVYQERSRGEAHITFLSI